MRGHLVGICTIAVTLAATAAAAQDAEPPTRQALVEQEQTDKASKLQPYVPSRFERVMGRAEDILTNQTITWHPYFESAAHGGGLTGGVGYLFHVSPYNSIDVRGSATVAGYKRAEAEFVAPRLFDGRGELSVLGGWREATNVNFYGIGPGTSEIDLMNYGFKEGYASTLLTLRPTRRLLMLRGGTELARWSPADTNGSSPSVDSVYTPATLSGLGATTTYVHTQATVALDSRPAPGYARRGGFYGVTAHDYYDKDDRFGFRKVDYEAIQHVPFLREAWVLSLRGRAETTFRRDGQDMPYYLLPHLGGGSTLRGFESWRFRDRNALLLQAEWRIMANRFMDTAVFYDAGKVAAQPSDLGFRHLEHDYGFGARFHGPFNTVLRTEIARSHETTRLVISTTQVF